MIRRRALLALLASAVACVCAAVLAGCGDDGGGAAEKEPVSLILDWYPNVDHAGVYGAISQDYFSDQGLDVTPKVPSDPTASLKQVGLGRADFAISYEQEVLLARSQGVPVVAVGAIVTHPLNTVLVRRDRGITTAKDLEGKTVGVAGASSDRPLLDSVVRSAGGAPSGDGCPVPAASPAVRGGRGRSPGPRSTRDGGNRTAPRRRVAESVAATTAASSFSR